MSLRAVACAARFVIESQAGHLPNSSVIVKRVGTLNEALPHYPRSTAEGQSLAP